MYIEGIVNSINVFSAYFLLIIVLSSFILASRVRDKNVAKRFIIYLVFGNFYISSIVFILAYLNIFNRSMTILSIILSSILIFAFLNRKDIKSKLIKLRESLGNIVLGEYGIRVLFCRIKNLAVEKTKSLFHELFDGKKMEWLIFLAIIGYNVYQYGINNLELVTYLAPDEEVHLFWIQSLLKGNIYPSGVYPHIFHNVLGGLIRVFHLNPMITLRYFASTSCILIMTTLYLGLRKIFNSKYPALLGFMIFSLVDLYYEQAIYRYQFAIPQEYGMMMLMPIAIFLFDYIEDKKLSDLVFFGLALSLSLGIHFYTGIIAIILVVSIGIVYLYRIIKEKILWKLILCGLLSLLLMLAPLGVGLALGNEMEQSMTWATEVIRGDIYEDKKEDKKEDLDEKEEVEADKEEPEETEEEKLTLEKFIQDAKVDVTKYVFHDIRVFYLSIVLILSSLVFNLIFVLRGKGKQKMLYKISFALNSLILLFLILLRSMQLPTIMETKRVAIYFAYFSSIWLGMPLELIDRLLTRSRFKRAISPISLGLIAVLLALVLKFNLLRPIAPFYYFQTSGTIIADMKIMKEYPDYTWTAVSPVNNISAVLGNGFHYELFDFIDGQEDWNSNKEIVIPTEYVFIYIEKMPMGNFEDGIRRGDPALSSREPVKMEDALKDFSKTGEDNFYYRGERNILMSKAYYWAKEYKKYFPNEMDVYYEDPELIVYRVEQNQYALNNFSIDYKINSR